MLNLHDIQVIASRKTDNDEEILRNVKIILSTLAGTVPFDRDFGINTDLLDEPINEVPGLFQVECILKLRKYEPRAKIESVDFIYLGDGKLNPKVVVYIDNLE
ncbi:MAG: hypothetical protein ACE3JQ_00235 [Paenisporosarcina sp.]